MSVPTSRYSHSRAGSTPSSASIACSIGALRRSTGSWNGGPCSQPIGLLRVLLADLTASPLGPRCPCGRANLPDSTGTNDAVLHPECASVIGGGCIRSQRYLEWRVPKSGCSCVLKGDSKCPGLCRC